MSKLRLTLAVGDYDITRPLIDGAVQPQGIDPVVVTYPSPERHWRMMRHREFDVCELSLASYVAGRSTETGDDLIAIPAFPHRRFRHGYIFVSASSEIRAPGQLAGQAVGVRTWQTTAGVWVRGMLAERYGLDLRTVRWMAQDPEDVPCSLPPGLMLRRVPDGRTVTDMCASGELAGLVYPELPAQLKEGHASIRRLFPDYKAAEQEYYKSTGIFPIMHLVAVKTDVASAYPWVPRALLQAFAEAKRLAMRRLEDPRTVSLAWLSSLQEEERALLGPDPWRYGLDETNRLTMETFLRYALEQGLAGRPLSAAELFWPATLDEVPKYV
jgi:4,5-dihydroxyphthalate decarboxylase